jgi:arginyl-tRNA synthetase
MADLKHGPLVQEQIYHQPLSFYHLYLIITTDLGSSSMSPLKYFLLKVDPKKRMMFNPAESIDFQGNTGPFIQYTHARICSITRKAKELGIDLMVTHANSSELTVTEIDLIYILGQYKSIIESAAEAFSPSLIAMYAYDVAKQFNKLYNELSILKEEDENKRNIRLTLTNITGKTIQHAFSLLGIVSPNKM